MSTAAKVGAFFLIVLAITGLLIWKIEDIRIGHGRPRKVTVQFKDVGGLDEKTAVRVASHYAGADLPESDALIKETIFELANQVVGNAISALNDQGFHFRVHPPLLLTADQGDKTSEDTEALMICFETSLGNVFMNVALRYSKRRMADHAAARA